MRKSSKEEEEMMVKKKKKKRRRRRRPAPGLGRGFRMDTIWILSRCGWHPCSRGKEGSSNER